jgi:hypothetical protein
MIYFNLSYNIILLQKRFLSFPSVETPTRYNTTLLTLIWDSKILEKNINRIRFLRRRYNHLKTMWEARKSSKNKDFVFEFYVELRKTLDKEVDIYTEKNAYHLMHSISNRFSMSYELARKLIDELQSIKPI